MTSADPNPESLEEFWDQEWEDTGADGDDAMSRRKLLGAAGTLLGLGTMLGGGFLLSTGTARADVATGGLNISGDSTVSDGGRLSSLTVSITSGHVSYDGLDRDAASIDINFYAAQSGNTVKLAANEIASQTASVGTTTGLDTRAGHYDYTFSDVNVFNSDDLSRTDFAATSDGTTTDTMVDFMVELVVLDGSGTSLVTATETSTATISVTNEARSGGANGSGSTTANGNNQNA